MLGEPLAEGEGDTEGEAEGDGVGCVVVPPIMTFIVYLAMSEANCGLG